MSSRPHTVGIVGAGLSGTALAIGLLRQSHAAPLRIVLIERSPAPGGLAYTRREYPYLLNVPAGRMSATSADPGEFLAFARRRQPGVTADSYLPRELYGDYLAASLANAQAACGAPVQLERILGSAIAIERTQRAGTVEIELADGQRVAADTVVLALGNPPPAPLDACAELRGSSHYIADPWQTFPAVQAGEVMLIAGTGLTMADVVLAGVHSSGGRAVFHAISRHGLLPALQTHFAPLEDCDSAPLLRAASDSLLQLLRAIRNLSEEVERNNGDWRAAITLVRDLAPSLWQRLPPTERRRFLRHARAYWDIHRHRLPEGVSATLHDLRRKDSLHIHAGRIVAIELAARRVRVAWRPRGARDTVTLTVDRIVNCTGPDYDVRNTQDKLLRALLHRGVATPDSLGLGLLTDETGALVDDSGRTDDHIYYLGPMLRPAYWETTAVAELSRHAERLARHLSIREE